VFLLKTFLEGQLQLIILKQFIKHLNLKKDQVFLDYFIIIVEIKHLKIKKDTIGIRVPKHTITQQIISLLGHPIMSMSLPPNEWDNYETDPEEIWQRFSKVVDLVIDGGIGQQQLSTIIDCTEENPIILREGAGAIPASII
jgi:tRNA threonylcarbamoyl adenosine modification protein (Sua5/YciO/YrdC/YwlC family)